MDTFPSEPETGGQAWYYQPFQMSLDTYVWETESSFLRQDKEKCDGKTVVKGIGTRDNPLQRKKLRVVHLQRK